MSDLRTAAQQALEALMDAQRHNYALKHKETGDLITTLSAALAEPQSTHSEECYKWHHECAIARIERKAEPEQKPVAWMHTNGVGHVYFRKKPQDKVFNPRPVYLKDE